MSDIGARFVACRRWRWMPGMLLTSGHRVTEDDIDSEPEFRPTNIRPVPEDPATLGCILALVREAWGDPSLYATTSWTDIPRRHVWWVSGSTLSDEHDTEAAALLAALEAAP